MSERGTVQEFIELVESYFERGATDGLPVVPPTNTRVDEMVTASGREAGEVLGVLAPAYRELRVGDVAVNAVMAGCLPIYMPVVIAALKVMMDGSFGLHHMATSTYGNGPLVVVNGPIRREIGLNCSGDVLGPGSRANATIGRAIRLVMINIGGAVPGVTDFASFGHPGKYTYVVGEDEEASPWETFHVEAGFPASDSAVTVLGATSPQRIGGPVTARNVEILLQRLATVFNVLTGFGSTGWSEVFVFVGPEHRDALQGAGWSKAEVRSFLHEHSGRRAQDRATVRARDEYHGDRNLFPADDPRSRLPILADRAAVEDETWLPAFESASDIHLIAAGGSGGHASMICFGQPGLDWGRHGTRRI